ncbi:MAG TPA: choice-of-anchor L domain-containing protein [Polyangiaceae bacterium]|nr:choice-of-anchor L domain-containing protein [Polyangiaceae bacterium]
MKSAFVSLSILATALLAGACAPGADSSTAGLGSGGSGSGTGGSSASSGGGSQVASTAAQFMDNVSSTGSSGPCASGPNDDADMDGFTGAEGDCNDCDPNVNPGAIEVMTADGTGGGGGAVPADEDCDGEIDNVPMPCDSGIALDTSSAMDGARAIELCHQPTGPKDWGVMAASWVRANGSPATANYQVGVLPDFGPNVAPRAGASMLAVSSGAARDLDDPSFCAHSCGLNGAGTAPTGFPQDVPGCSGDTDINDDVALKVQLRAPTNATGFKFDFKFYSNEYPEYVCTMFNDQFIALVQPPPDGSINGNVSFDSQNNPVSVNIAFFDVCNSGANCTAGGAQLVGTDFDPDDGGTSWLETSAPISAGEEFTIQFTIWDTGDSAWDSTTLIDNFSWVANGGTVTVGTIKPPQ